MGDSRLSRLIVSEAHVDRLNECIDRLIEEGNARWALLLDRSGQILTCRGEESGQGTETLGALLAGNFASAREIARMLGEDSFGAVFQQGQHRHVFTALISEHWILSVVFDHNTPVGLVKVLCGRTAEGLREVHGAVCRENDSGGEGRGLDESFRLLVQRSIDLLLQDGK